MDASQEEFQEQPARGALAKQHLSSAVLAALEEGAENGPTVSTETAKHVVDLVWDWTTTALAPDLEAFMRHSKRSTIGVEDVQLSARKNARTKAFIDEEARRLRSRKTETGETLRIALRASRDAMQEYVGWTPPEDKASGRPAGA